MVPYTPADPHYCAARASSCQQKPPHSETSRFILGFALLIIVLWIVVGTAVQLITLMKQLIFRWKQWLGAANNPKPLRAHAYLDQLTDRWCELRFGQATASRRKAGQAAMRAVMAERSRLHSSGQQSNEPS